MTSLLEVGSRRSTPIVPQAIKAARLARDFDVQPLVAAVARIADDEWRHIIEDESEWSGWTAAALMSHDGQVTTLDRGPTYVPTDLCKREEAFKKLMCFFHAPLQRVRVMRLAAGGGEILEHSDEMPDGNDTLVRLHLPLTGADMTDFTSEGERVPMKLGELWYVDVTRLHSVVNRGERDRVTLVVDCERNSWVDWLIDGSAHMLLSDSPRSS